MPGAAVFLERLRAVSVQAQPDEESLGCDIAIGDGRSHLGDPCVGERAEAPSHHSGSDSEAFVVGRYDDRVDAATPFTTTTKAKAAMSSPSSTTWECGRTIDAR